MIRTHVSRVAPDWSRLSYSATNLQQFFQTKIQLAKSWTCAATYKQMIKAILSYLQEEDRRESLSLVSFLFEFFSIWRIQNLESNIQKKFSYFLIVGRKTLLILTNFRKNCFYEEYYYIKINWLV